MRDPERRLHVVGEGDGPAAPVLAVDPEGVRVVFTCAHEHAGVGYLPGAAGVVTPAARDKLRLLGVIEG